VDNWEIDLNKSARAFHTHIRPIFIDLCGGEIIHTEALDDCSFSRHLDIHSGIDAWHVHPDHGARGLALRVQSMEYPFHTFTIRKSRNSGTKTEYQKRKEAIEKGWLYPHLTIQGYVSSFDDEGELLCFAIGRTSQLLERIDALETLRSTQGEYAVLEDCYTDSTYNADFYVIHWTQQNSLYTHLSDDYKVKINWRENVFA